jgi:opacity protein-like surface antigen
MQKITGFLVLALASTALMAQSSQSAVGNVPSLSVGAEFSSFNPDYGCPSNLPFHCGNSKGLLRGAGVFGDFNLRPNWSVEGEARWMHSPGGESESTYLAGGRYRFFHTGKFDFWGKALVGRGSVTTIGSSTSGVKGSYFVIAPGATLDYHLTSRFSFRVDYEYQKWPSFVGPATSTGAHNHGLTPNGISFGISYRFGAK